MPREQETPFQKAVRDSINQIQVALFEYEKNPPLSRSEILQKAMAKLRNAQELVGHRDGTQAFRLHLVDLAGFLVYAASLVGENKIEHH